MDTMGALIRSLSLTSRNPQRESEDAYYARNAGTKHGLRALLRRARH